jgi:hypothetical protein
MFGDIRAISTRGAIQSGSPLQIPPYRINPFQYYGLKNVAFAKMDRLSIGMVILEILVGTDLMITATLEELHDKLL